MKASLSCPWCGFEGAPRSLHAHLGDRHPEMVAFETTAARNSYSVTCPVCGSGYVQAIKPRLTDPSFLEEYRAEIRLVAFDMLINHLLAEHDLLDSAGPPREDEL